MIDYGPGGASLRRRLLFSLGVLFFCGLATITVYLRQASDKTWWDVTDRSLQAQAMTLAGAYRAHSAQPLAELPAEWRDAYDRPGSGFAYTIYDRALRPIASSASLRGGQLAPGTPLQADQRISDVTLIGPSSVPTVSVRLPGGGTAVVARSGMQAEALVESLHDEDIETILVFALFGLLAMTVIAAVSIWSLKPIVAASRAAIMIGPQTLHKRIDTQGVPIEILPLVDAFNGALDRLGLAQVLQRRLTADAAHELRTPLAVLSLRLQRARMGEGLDWPAIITDLARMSRLIEQLLDLARKEANASVAEGRGDVRLSRVVREAAALVLPLAEEQGRRIEVDVPAHVMMRDSREADLLDMVRNLIENAIIHGDGTVHVRLAAAGDDMVCLTVADAGPTPPAAESLFLRFRRGEEQKPGSGLGLAIVREVAGAHGGSVSFADSATTRLEVLLPIAKDVQPSRSTSQGRTPRGTGIGPVVHQRP